MTYHICNISTVCRALKNKEIRNMFHKIHLLSFTTSLIFMKVEMGLGAKGLIPFSTINHATRHKAKAIRVKYAMMKTNMKMNRITCGPTFVLKNKINLKYVAELFFAVN